MDTNYDDDEDLPRKRRVPATSFPLSTAATLVESQYFNAESSGSLTNPRRQSRSSLPNTGGPTLIADMSLDDTVNRSPSKPQEEMAPGSAAAPGSDFDYGDIDADILAALDKENNDASQKSSSADPGPKEPSTQANLQSQDVISVDSDEEEVDKENVPVPTRRVRRRMAAPVRTSQTSTTNEEIIELSSD